MKCVVTGNWIFVLELLPVFFSLSNELCVKTLPVLNVPVYKIYKIMTPAFEAGELCYLETQPLCVFSLLER